MTIDNKVDKGQVMENFKDVRNHISYKCHLVTKELAFMVMILGKFHFYAFSVERLHHYKDTSLSQLTWMKKVTNE